MSDYFIAALRKRRVIGVTVRPHPHPNVWNCERCVRERGREREREREIHVHPGCLQRGVLN